MLDTHERLASTLLACLMATGLQAACTGDSQRAKDQAQTANPPAGNGNEDDGDDQDDDGDEQDDDDDHGGGGPTLQFEESKILPRWPAAMRTLSTWPRSCPRRDSPGMKLT
ncbi:MAG TPA: hypothetical protein VKB80_20580 [Kofleriaceae bacterium]|nr:hypothetical protein [Kofleriaceae bacterium]